jgi:hypothetical protein
VIVICISKVLFHEFPASVKSAKHHWYQLQKLSDHQPGFIDRLVVHTLPQSAVLLLWKYHKSCQVW